MKPKFNLEDLKRENIYNVPENYFDRLPNRIMQRVTATPPETSGAFGWFPKPLRLALAGTGFAAVFATVFMLNTQETGVTLEQKLARLDQTEIVNYLLANDRLERGDLAMLNLTNADLTAEFITADQSDIRQALEDEPLEDLYL